MKSVRRNAICREEEMSERLKSTLPPFKVEINFSIQPFLNAKKLLLKALDILEFFRYTIYENSICFQKHMRCKQKHIK